MSSAGACIVMFFTPYLGCLNLAAHWQAEQIKLQRSDGQFPDNNYTFYNDGKVQTVDWREIYRSNIDDVHIEGAKTQPGRPTTWEYTTQKRRNPDETIR